MTIRELIEEWRARADAFQAMCEGMDITKERDEIIASACIAKQLRKDADELEECVKNKPQIIMMGKN